MVRHAFFIEKNRGEKTEARSSDLSVCMSHREIVPRPFRWTNSQFD